jgi:hypothetical protein
MHYVISPTSLSFANRSIFQIGYYENRSGDLIYVKGTDNHSNFKSLMLFIIYVDLPKEDSSKFSNAPTPTSIRNKKPTDIQ